jgi:hypothetical protein
MGKGLVVAQEVGLPGCRNRLVVFLAVRLEVTGGRAHYVPLALDAADIEPREFGTYEEAQTVVKRYNDGPKGDGVWAARWDSVKADWTVTMREKRDSQSKGSSDSR